MLQLEEKNFSIALHPSYHILHTLAPTLVSLFLLIPTHILFRCLMLFHVMLCLFSCHIMCYALSIHKPSVIHFYPIPPPIIISPKETCLDSYQRIGTVQMEPRPCLTLERKSRTTSHHNKLDTYYCTHLFEGLKAEFSEFPGTWVTSGRWAVGARAPWFPMVVFSVWVAYPGARCSTRPGPKFSLDLRCRLGKKKRKKKVPR